MSFLRGVATYGLSNALTAAVQFAVMLMFAKILGAEGFGYLSVFFVVYIVFSMVVGMGLTAAAQRSYFTLSLEDFRVLISSTVKLVALVGILIGLVVIVVPINVAVHVGLPKVWILYALFAAMGQMVIQTTQIVLQSQMRPRPYALITVLQVTLFVISTASFILLRETRWQWAVLSFSSVPIITAAVSLAFFARDGYGVMAWSSTTLKKALAYSVPLVPHQVAGWAIAMVDRFIIVSHFGPAAVGVYSLSFQVAQATNIVSSSINQAVVPVLFRQLAKPEPDWSKIRKINYLYGLALAVFSIAFFALFEIFAPLLLNKEYIMALEYVPWLIFAFLCLSLSRIASNYLMYYERTGRLALLTMLSSLVSVALNISLVPQYGVIAACWSSVIAFSLLCVTTWGYTAACRK